MCRSRRYRSLRRTMSWGVFVPSWTPCPRESCSSAGGRSDAGYAWLGRRFGRPRISTFSFVTMLDRLERRSRRSTRCRRTPHIRVALRASRCSSICSPTICRRGSRSLVLVGWTSASRILTDSSCSFLRLADCWHEARSGCAWSPRRNPRGARSGCRQRVRSSLRRSPTSDSTSAHRRSAPATARMSSGSSRPSERLRSSPISRPPPRRSEPTSTSTSSNWAPVDSQVRLERPASITIRTVWGSPSLDWLTV